VDTNETEKLSVYPLNCRCDSLVTDIKYSVSDFGCFVF